MTRTGHVILASLVALATADLEYSCNATLEYLLAPGYGANYVNNTTPVPIVFPGYPSLDLYRWPEPINSTAGEYLINFLAELPPGTNQKWAVSLTTGVISWVTASGVLRVNDYIGYPTGLGVLPRGLQRANAPLDVVTLGAYLLRGSVTTVKVVGVWHMVDQGLVDDKILTVVKGTPMWDVNDITDLETNYKGVLDIIITWYTNYIQNRFTSNGVEDAPVAWQAVVDALARANITGTFPTVPTAPSNCSAMASLVAPGYHTTADGRTLVCDSDPAFDFYNTEFSVPAGLEPQVVEIPAGDAQKWEVNTSGVMSWDIKNGVPRVVAYLGYLGNYGIVPRTLGGDGDPLDVLSLGCQQLRGSIIGVKVVGVMNMLDGSDADDKLIAVVPGTHMYDVVDDLPQLNATYPGVLFMIKTWFENYKGTGSGITVTGYGNRTAAYAVLNAAKESYIAQFVSGASPPAATFCLLLLLLVLFLL
eukprot:TRINITY_DN689_c0_g1_i4.p1 TRINITY_DN689_c0_g1~~TRINITY_DN689_c0_g1_i4.p1  ORF type:complete len:475 (-),score=132.06 TRINITY_DN689_c0_g1_i4:64-1488(-)